jgi:ABC-2 type transport system ATP-binding protein
LSVAENLACFAGVGHLSGIEKKSRIAHCLAFAQLERYATVHADRLSGGLKRRLNLAIAMLHRPELLLFDEPTVGVDPQSRAFLLHAIKQLAQDGCAVIYTSHYMEEVEAIADRVVILDQGRVLIQGALVDLLNTSGTLLQLTVDGGELERLQAVLSPFGEITHHGAGVQLTLASRHHFSAAIAAVDAAGLVVSQVRFGHADLEQLFMSLTHHSLRD